MTVLIRARTSGSVFSVSGCDGGVWPVSFAAAYFAESHRPWTWPTKSY
jgi:hypothetical protein